MYGKILRILVRNMISESGRFSERNRHCRTPLVSQ